MERTVLCYIEDNDSYLMLLRNKKKNDMNKGKWLGVGGHIEKNETSLEAIKREVLEETNLVLNSVKLRGILYFRDTNYEETIDLYTSDDFKGSLKECDEGELRWIKKTDILDLNLWEGDRIFLGKLLNDDVYFELELNYVDGMLHDYRFVR